MITYGLLDILQQRVGQLSFHIASEKSIRIEFIRFSKGEKLGPLKFGGDIVITCLKGSFLIGEQDTSVTVLSQVVLSEGESLNISCTSDEGAVQIIWAPPFAETKQE